MEKYKPLLGVHVGDRKRRGQRTKKQPLSFNQLEWRKLTKRAKENVALAKMPLNKKGEVYKSVARAKYFLTITRRNKNETVVQRT